MAFGFYIIPRIGGLAYLNMPKSACTSILYSLSKMRLDNDYVLHEGLLEDGSDSIHGFYPPHAHLQNFFSRWPVEYPPLPSSYIKFTFVRNPYARLYSFYKSKIKLGQSPGDYYQRFGLKKGASFSSCVKILTSIDPNDLEHHALPQAMLVYQNGRTLVDFIGKVESFSDDWPVVQKLSGYNLELSEANSVKGAVTPVYTPELKQCVYDYYRSDFELFDYDKDSVTVKNTQAYDTKHATYVLHNFNEDKIKQLKCLIDTSNDHIRKVSEEFAQTPENRNKYFEGQSDNFRELMLKVIYYQESNLIELSKTSGSLECSIGALKKSIEVENTRSNKLTKSVKAAEQVSLTLVEKMQHVEKHGVSLETDISRVENDVSLVLSKTSELDDRQRTFQSSLKQSSLKQSELLNITLTKKIDNINESISDESNRNHQFLNEKISSLDKAIRYEYNRKNKLLNKKICGLDKTIRDERDRNYQLKKMLHEQILLIYSVSRKSYIKRLKRFVRYRKPNEYNLLQETEYFDAPYYYSQYPSVIKMGMPALKHYILYGVQEGKNPSSSFRTTEYLLANPSVAYLGLNPLFHYLVHK